MTDNKINIAKLLYAAYPHADLLPIDPVKDCRDLNSLLAKVTEEDMGDSLFRFMVVEIVEGGESSLSGAIRVIARARDDAQAVLEALYMAENPKTQHLYEVQATEYNGCQEYAQSKLLTAANIVDAIKAARAYFQGWYDDGEDSKEHRINDPDVFVFNGGAIRLVIRSIQKVTLSEWVHSQLQLHGVDLVQHQCLQTVDKEGVLDACRTLLSYTSDLLYRLDNQVRLDEIQEICQAKAAVAQYESNGPSVESRQIQLSVRELSPDYSPVEIPVHLLCEHGKLWIRPRGYGDACSEEGYGFPIALELWQGRLRLVVFSDINNEEPQIIDLEKAKESCRIDAV
ncbi:MAG: hypothetical protein GX625_17150 [Clostridiaceae bacterium]|nr:hypothetical protein [Clostridiaceae bacterium]